MTRYSCAILKPWAGERVQPRVVVMVKEPRAGFVKTRLARDLGRAQATRVFRQTLAAVAQRLARDRRWKLELAVAPRASVASLLFPPRVARRPQAQGNLGARLKAVAEAAGIEPVLIIGSDIPGIDASHVERAFALLRTADAVLGPALDGGYWCVGVRRPRRLARAFLGVRWSSPRALSDTVAALLVEGAVQIAFAEVLGDIDTKDDLPALRMVLGRVVLSGNRSFDLRRNE